MAILGKGGTSSAYVSATGTALEALSAGDQIRMTKSGAFIKNETSVKPVPNQLVGVGGGGGWSWTGSTLTNRTYTPYNYQSSTYKAGNFGAYLSNGFYLWLFYQYDNSGWNFSPLVSYHTINVNSSTSTLDVGALNTYGYSFTEFTGYPMLCLQELKNDGTNTYVAAMYGTSYHSGNVNHLAPMFLKIRNSDGNIRSVQGFAGTNPPDTGDWYDLYWNAWNCGSKLCNDILVVPYINNNNGGVQFQYKRVNLTHDTAYSTSAIASATGWTNSGFGHDTISASSHGYNTSHRVIVLNEANRIIMLTRSSAHVPNNGTNRKQYKIIGFSATGDTKTTHVDWTNFTGSDEGGRLALDKMSGGQIVQLGTNSFAAINNSDGNTMEVQKWTYDPSDHSIAESGSKYTVQADANYTFGNASSSSTPARYRFAHYHESNEDQRVSENHIWDHFGGDQIWIDAGANFYQGYPHYSLLNLTTNTWDVIDLSNALGTSSTLQPTTNTMHFGDGVLSGSPLTGDNSNRGARVLMYKNAAIQTDAGLTREFVGETTAAVAQDATATIQLYKGIEAEGTLSSSYYVAKNDMFYALNVTGAPADPDIVKYPIPTFVPFAQWQLSSNASVSGYFDDKNYNTYGAAYANTSVTTDVFEILGAGSLERMAVFPSNSTYKYHHMVFYIDGNIVFNSAIQSHFNGQPQFNYRNAWSLHATRVTNATPAGFGVPITFKKSLKMQIVSPQSADSWYYRLVIINF